MTMRPPLPTQEEQFASAVREAERLAPGHYWLFSKGRLTAEEPLYAFALYEKGDSEEPVAIAEHDDPVETVLRAIDELHRKAEATP